MYKGQRFTVACSVLGVPATKEGSREAANVWWRRKRAEIDSSGPSTPPTPFYSGQEQWAWPYAPSFLDEYECWVRGLGLPKEEEEKTLHEIARGIVQVMWERHGVEGHPLPDHMAKLLSDEKIRRLEGAIKTIRGEPAAAPDQAVKAHAEAWLRRQQALAEAGQMAPARVANNRTCLGHFLAFLGPDSDVAGIDADNWDRFYLWLLSSERLTEKGKSWATAYRRDVFNVARAFVRWLWEKKVIELPRNIDQKFKAGPAAKAVTTWTPDEFKAAVQEAPGKLKLAILLMANIGATQQVVADLQDAEVDWLKGRITRKRSKTAGHENVPTLEYLLWPETFRLLKQYRSGGELVLLTEGGQPYVRTELRADGRLSKADGFASHWVHVKKRLDFHRPLKELRKLGATLLASHEVYGRFQAYFLGHSPRTVADRNYVRPPQALFDEAITWLGQQLGQVPSSAP
jgi:integrase